MFKPGKFTGRVRHYLRDWQMEIWMAIVLSAFFYFAITVGDASPGIAWTGFAVYVGLVVIHQWTKGEREHEVHKFRADLESKIQEVRSVLERSNRDLITLSDLRMRFISTLSHELRTPLTAIQESVNIIFEGVSGGPPTPEQQRFLAMARRNVDRITTVLNELSDLSKLQAGKMKINLGKVAMEEIVEGAVRSVMPSAQKKNLDLKMEVKWNLPPVLGDRQRLGEVLVNLLDNAVKFTLPDGRIGISARPGGDVNQLEICVWDTGCGISPEHVGHLFEGVRPFGGNEGAMVPGLGLGLAICKEIVTQLGGSIWAESEPGKGSQVYFTVPVFSDEALLHAHFRHAVREANFKNTSVMLFCIGLQDQHTQRMVAGGPQTEAALQELHEFVASYFRLDDRMVLHSARGRIYVLMFFRGQDVRDRMQRLDKFLRGKTFFAGDKPQDLRIAYAFARFPHDGDNLEVLHQEIDRQLRSGGVDLDDMPLSGAA